MLGSVSLYKLPHISARLHFPFVGRLQYLILFILHEDAGNTG